MSGVHTATTDAGEQFVSGVYQLGNCGCKINGGGTLQQPIRIEYCPMHAAAPELLEALRAAHEALYNAPMVGETYDQQHSDTQTAAALAARAAIDRATA